MASMMAANISMQRQPTCLLVQAGTTARQRGVSFCK